MVRRTAIRANFESPAPAPLRQVPAPPAIPLRAPTAYTADRA
jgi:hypothetical protein